MTVSTTDTRVEYNGDGSTQVFPFFFSTLDPAHITVVLLNVSSSPITFNGTTIAVGQNYTATLNTDYSISLSSAGGDVDFGISDAPPNGLKVTISRNTPLTQNTDYVEGDAFPAKSHEDALDKLTLQAQEIQRRAEFSISYPEGDDPSSHGTLPFASDRAGKALTFDASGNPSTAKDIPAATVSSFAETLLDDISASEVRGTLNLGSIATQDASSVSITGGSISGITDLAVVDGGTGASNTSGARSNLGLVIGTDVQKYDPLLDDIADASVVNNDFIVGQGNNLLGVVGPSSARNKMGLGSLATQDTVNNSDWSGTDLAVTNGGTGASVPANARSNLNVRRIEYARMEKSSKQGTANSTSVTVTWQTVKFDTLGSIANTTNDRFDIPSNAVVAIVHAGISWGDNSSGQRVIRIKKNGSNKAIAQYVPTFNSVNTLSTGPISVTGGDTIQVEVLQSSGGSLNVEDDDVTFFGIEVIE